MIIQPYRTIDNVIEGAVITFVDITEVKRTRDELNISEIRYRTLFETAQEGILILDAETGSILNVNPYLIDLLGFSEKQLLEKKIWDIGFFGDEVSKNDVFRDIKQNKSLHYKNIPLEAADGHKIKVEFIGNVFVIDCHVFMQCNIRVSTEGQES